VIGAESSGDPNAVSKVGAGGLMQLMPDTAKGYGVDAYNPQQNVWAGSRMLAGLIRKYHGNLAQALAAYNWGSGNVDSGRPWPPETQAYVNGVIQRFLASGGVR
jgi:soluble lytic murein transglycosylase-like protein